jgi:site-specific DNA-methyltransferase (adenine-specific)
LSVYKEDAFLLLARLKPESINLCVTDPPYESLEKYRAVGTTTRLKHSQGSSNDWFQTIPNSRLPELLTGLWRVLADNSHCYLFCDDETSNLLWLANRELGAFKWWKRVVWNKVSMGMGYHYRAQTEFIVFLEKGHRNLTSRSIPDFLDPEALSALVAQKKIYRGYPTEKPPEVSAVLIEQSTAPGEVVLDPFCGSGSVGVAAQTLGRRFIGADIADTAVTLTQSRLAALIQT